MERPRFDAATTISGAMVVTADCFLDVEDDYQLAAGCSAIDAGVVLEANQHDRAGIPRLRRCLYTGAFEFCDGDRDEMPEPRWMRAYQRWTLGWFWWRPGC